MRRTHRSPGARGAADIQPVDLLVRVFLFHLAVEGARRVLRNFCPKNSMKSLPSKILLWLASTTRRATGWPWLLSANVLGATVVTSTPAAVRFAGSDPVQIVGRHADPQPDRSDSLGVCRPGAEQRDQDGDDQ